MKPKEKRTGARNAGFVTPSRVKTAKCKQQTAPNNSRSAKKYRKISCKTVQHLLQKRLCACMVHATVWMTITPACTETQFPISTDTHAYCTGYGRVRSNAQERAIEATICLSLYTCLWVRLTSVRVEVALVQLHQTLLQALELGFDCGVGGSLGSQIHVFSLANPHTQHTTKMSMAL